MILSRAAPVLLIALLAGCDAQELVAPPAIVPPAPSAIALDDSTAGLRAALAAASDDAAIRLVPAIGDESETGELSAALKVLTISLDGASSARIGIAMTRAGVALTRLENSPLCFPGRAANLAAVRLVLERVSTVLAPE